MALVVIIVIGALALSIRNGSADADTSVIKEAKASIGNVSKTISASGTLSDDASVNIKVPAGIVINEVCVSEGDQVKKGDVLAKVDRASVARVLLELKDEKEDIEDARDSLTGTSDTTSDNYLKKIIYNSEISDLESAISKLQEMLDSCAIKATKSGTVTGVSAADGMTVGEAADTDSASASASGTAASGMSTTSSSMGSVSTTAATLNSSTATASTTAATLSSSTATASTTATTQSSSTATASTTAAELSTTAATTSSSSAASGKEALLAATSSQTVYADGVACDAGFTLTSSEEDTEEDDSRIVLASEGEPDEGGDEKDEPVVITKGDLTTLMITAPVEGAMPQKSIASTSEYEASISWNTDSAFKAGSTYTAVVELTSKDGYCFGDASQYDIAISGGTLIDGTPKVTGGDGSGNKLIIKVSFTAESNGSSKSGDSGQGSGNSGSGSDSGSGSGFSGGSSSVKRSSGSTSSGTTSSSTSTSSSLTDTVVDMVTVFSMSSDDAMSVEVSVDESDINSVQVGQTATVTLDAVEGETLEGEITKVSSTSSSGSGGNVKYPVTITIDKTEDMKSGMTASAVINIEEASDVIVIPSAAINEKGGKTFVYTENKNDELSGEVEITTGLSNGNMVEVTDGLSEGTTVYYEVKTSGSSDKGSDSSGMPDMSNMPGDMPDMSNMPSGGPGGTPPSMPGNSN